MVNPLLVAGIAQGISSVFGNRAARRAQEAAEAKARKAARQAIGQGKEAGRQQYAEDMKFLSGQYAAAGKAVYGADRRRREAIGQYGKTVAKDMAGYKAGQRELKQDTFRDARGAARQERRISAKDEENRFVRLREAADKAGFNPLTLIQAGYLGSTLPTGILSAGDHLAWGMQESANNVSVLGAKLGAASTMAGFKLDAAGALEAGVINVANARVAGQQNARSLSHVAQDMTFSHIMEGHNAEVSAGAAAHDQALSRWDRVTSAIGAIGSGWQGAQDRAVERQQIAHNQWVDRQNIGLQQQQLAMTASALATGRQAGSGPVLVGTASGSWGSSSAPVPGRVVSGGTGVNVLGYEVHRTDSTSSYDELESVLGSEGADAAVLADAAVATPIHADGFTPRAVWDWVLNDLSTGDNPLAHVTNTVREWWSMSPRLTEAPSWQGSQAQAVANWPG